MLLSLALKASMSTSNVVSDRLALASSRSKASTAAKSTLAPGVDRFAQAIASATPSDFAWAARANGPGEIVARLNTSSTAARKIAKSPSCEVFA
jgi:hypothetical protein